MSDVVFLMYLIRSLLLASTDIIIKNYPSSPNTSKVKIPLNPYHGSGQRDAGENSLLQFDFWRSSAEKSLSMLIINFTPEVFHSAE